MIKKLIQKLNDIPIDFEYTDKQPLDGQGFSYMSYDSKNVYGTFWKNPHKQKHAWIVLFHGLGAHTQTEGYLSFVQDWLNEGYDVIGIDVRGQGGRTPLYLPIDPRGLYHTGYPDFESYYYTSIYLDAYRLIDLCHIIEPSHKIIVNGGSQGGALALFTGAMHPNVDLILSDMPSNCDIDVLIHESKGGFQIFKTLDDISSWMFEEIDLLNYATSIQVPTLLSSGSLDLVCPLKTCEKLYRRLHHEKAMFIYQGFGHGGYDDLHFSKKLIFINKHIK